MINHKLKYFRRRMAATLLLLVGTYSTAVAQYGETAPIVGTGRVSVRKPADRLRALIPLSARGKTVRKAAESLKEKAAAVVVLVFFFSCVSEKRKYLASSTGTDCCLAWTFFLLSFFLNERFVCILALGREERNYGERMILNCRFRPFLFLQTTTLVT